MSASIASPATRASVGFPAGHLFGFTMTNGTDATNDIDFAAGQCRNSTDVVNIVGSAIAGKQLDATWAAGANAGGRMSAAAIANTTYHCYAILKDSDGSVDYGFDTSATAPTMPSGYTYFRRIGSILRESAAIVAFTQQGDTFLRNTPANSVDTANPTDGATVQAVMSVPLGVAVDAILTARLYDGTPAANTTAVFTSGLQANLSPATSSDIFIDGDATLLPLAECISKRLMTDTSGQIKYRINGATADHVLTIVTFGWVDNRGRSA